MVKVNLGGCSSFVNDADYKANVEKALSALEVLENETGKGNDFLGWKHLPSETLAGSLVADCEAVRDAWKAKNIDLVVVIGIGGSYLGAKCALEALSHQFAKQLKNKGEAPEIVFAGQNLSEVHQDIYHFLRQICVQVFIITFVCFIHASGSICVFKSFITHDSNLRTKISQSIKTYKFTQYSHYILLFYSFIGEVSTKVAEIQRNVRNLFLFKPSKNRFLIKLFTKNLFLCFYFTERMVFTPSLGGTYSTVALLPTCFFMISRCSLAFPSKRSSLPSSIRYQ